ncbi:ESX secretion-associated protein EspG [Antrihabitans sp. YC3-6]|uniref:ESX secretion-associated protein EspG n=1 Tax=Antrihabitans stalagmiti TaxID=2799499 RepID=A0A934U271_9NOCA|nr:ESX secretion-associated protein EspG [Antrihabitans stalagmiti]MBJ8338597.1 ESX secretion-associated protein EspG [Antrihabitans stalagmiti]
MANTWRIKPMEFLVLWEISGNDTLPFPIVCTNTPPLLKDYIRQKEQILEELQPRLTRESVDAIQTVSRPDIKIAAIGWDEHNENNLSAARRIYGVRRENRAYVLSQAPGSKFEEGGDIEITETSVVGLARSVIDKLPQVSKGSMGEVPIMRGQGRDLDYSHGQSAVRDSFAESPEQKSARFLRAKSTQFGEFEVLPGESMHWLRERSGYLMRWRDVADDGRYLVEPRDHPVAVAVDAKGFENAANERVAKLVRRIKEDKPKYEMQ